MTIPALAAYCASKYALEAIADAYRYELLPFGVDSILVEPGVYRTGIHDRFMLPADGARLADYGGSAKFAERVNGVFQAIVGAPDAPGSSEVVDALVGLIDMAPEQRPFRTVVSAPIQQLRTMLAPTRSDRWWRRSSMSLSSPDRRSREASDVGVAC